jgi:hypothetical protein
MLDWIVFLESVLGWVQWLTTLTILGLCLIAVIYYFVNKRAMFDCILLVIVLIIIAGVFAKYGIAIVNPAIYDFFRSLF